MNVEGDTASTAFSNPGDGVWLASHDSGLWRRPAGWLVLRMIMSDKGIAHGEPQKQLAVLEVL